MWQIYNPVFAFSTYMYCMIRKTIIIEQRQRNIHFIKEEKTVQIKWVSINEKNVWCRFHIMKLMKLMKLEQREKFNMMNFMHVNTLEFIQ